jgi:hypothetical protein|tara:strand:- start:292 stop:453 length:162 start_codon:yes stop_codon:yes gene_type:complete
MPSGPGTYGSKVGRPASKPMAKSTGTKPVVNEKQRIADKINKALLGFPVNWKK